MIRDLLDPFHLPPWFWWTYASLFHVGLLWAWAQ